MDNKKDNLNFNYKKISDDEILFDNVHNTNEKDFNKKEIITEMIKGNISDLVKNQLNKSKQEKQYQLLKKSLRSIIQRFLSNTCLIINNTKI